MNGTIPNPSGHSVHTDDSRKESFGKTGLQQGAIAALLVGAGYYLGARIGFALTFQPHPVSVLWPPNSILLAALLLTSPRRWWIVIAAAFPAHWLAQLQSQVPPTMIFCWYISNCCEALIGAGAICLFAGTPFRLDRLRNLGIFLFCGAVLGPGLSSFLDSAFVLLNNWTQESYWTVWRMRFFSNVLTALTVAPVILTAGALRRPSIRAVPFRTVLEAAALAASLLVVSVVVFHRPGPATGLIPTLMYAPLPFLLWATVRFGLLGESLAVLAVAFISIWGVAHGKGPFATRSPEESALSVQVFLTAVSVNLMALGVILKERRQSDRELRATQERYREVVESQTDLVCRYLPDTTLTFVNEAFCRFFDVGRQHAIGRKLVDFVCPDERRATMGFIEDLVKTHRTAAWENETLSAAGKRAWHHWTSHVIEDGDGALRELQATGRDITDRKRADEVNKTLAHVSRLAVVGELTAMIAHEVNQPLGAILSNTDAAELLLESGKPPLDQIADILADIRKDDLRASQAIHRIRALLRKREMQLGPVDVNETIDDVVHLVTGDALRRNVQIRGELDRSLPNVVGDKVHLQQVFLNLVLNGMDAMNETPEGKRDLVIKTGRFSPHFCQILVADSGHGISAEILPKLFDSFFTTKKDGMGLGLSISRAIVEAHQGHIWAENNPQTGATFLLTLPFLAE